MQAILLDNPSATRHGVTTLKKNQNIRLFMRILSMSGPWAVRAASSLLLVLIAIASYGQNREGAVRKAREGQTEQAIIELRQILADHPDDKEAALDLAVVLTWAKRPREATDVFERAGVTAPPDWVLLAMARAYRDQQRLADAQRVTREGRLRFPENQLFAVLELLLT